MKEVLRLSLSAALVACAFVANAQPLAKTGEYRRVVTKLEDNGRADVMIDERAPVTAGRSANGTADVWATTRSPAQLSFAQDLGRTKVGIAPPRGGTSFRVVDFAPTTEAIGRLPLDTVMKLVGEDAPRRGLPPIHPMMHRTRSVDYAVVVSGEIQMLLDDSTVTLRPGDIVVQQATNHAWINRGQEYARVVFVLVDAEEP